MESSLLSYIKYIVHFLELEDLDIHFVTWLLWLWWPFILVTVILPIVIILLLYTSACIVHLYKIRHWFNVKEFLTNENLNKARAAVSLLWECHGWFWHGYEVVGLENIPKEGGGLVVYYHGAIPVDYYYLASRYFLHNRRPMRTIAAGFLFKMPGLRFFMEVIQATPGSVDSMADLLREGEVISVAPGGIREAQFSDENYKLIWNNRMGFAKAACLGKAPVIPVFTQNIREAYRTCPFFHGLFRWLYDKTKLPLVPIYGGFPVKLRTFIGKPIPYDENSTPEDMAEKAALAIKELIAKHQDVPGSVLRALFQRTNRLRNHALL